jgi:hypothetical protein
VKRALWLLIVVALASCVHTLPPPAPIEPPPGLPIDHRSNPPVATPP